MILSTLSFLSATIFHGVQRKPIFPQFPWKKTGRVRDAYAVV
jgi:hypothetical protein